MNDQNIRIFITMARRYFEALEPKPTLVIEPPFLRDELGPLLEYTGIIPISGRCEGAVCFTANGGMLETILSLLKDDRRDDAAKRDLVGEIANTLSGNAREEFGSDFRISVPTVIVGPRLSADLRTGGRNYAIPLNWRCETAYLLVSLKWVIEGIILSSSSFRLR
jgi:chemotaxis protein CheX